MPQYPKPEVERAIADAALRVFAREGFPSATMAEIAREAEISTGNIYRYFDGKDALFHAVVPESFAVRLAELLRERVDAAAGVEDLRALPPDASYPVVSERLLSFAIENRLRVVIVLGRGEGTRYEGFGEDVRRFLTERAIEHFRALNPSLAITTAVRFGLEQIYRNFLASLVAILDRFRDEKDIRVAVDAYTRYHLVGLKSYFQ